MKRVLTLVCVLALGWGIALRAQDLSKIAMDARDVGVRFWSIHKDISYVENDSGDGWLMGPTARTIYWGGSGTKRRSGAVNTCPVTVCDGQRAWVLIDPKAKTMSVGPARFGGDVIRDCLAWFEDVPMTAKLTKKVKIEGREYHVISWTTNLPLTMIDLYVSAERLYLLKRTELVINGEYSEKAYSEFQEVGGVMIPMKRTELLRSEDEDSVRTYRITDLKVDQKFPDSLFDPVRIVQEKR